MLLQPSIPRPYRSLFFDPGMNCSSFVPRNKSALPAFRHMPATEHRILSKESRAIRVPPLHPSVQAVVRTSFRYGAQLATRGARRSHRPPSAPQHE